MVRLIKLRYSFIVFSPFCNTTVENCITVNEVASISFAMLVFNYIERRPSNVLFLSSSDSDIRLQKIKKVEVCKRVVVRVDV